MIKNLRLRHGIESWDAQYHRSVFAWGGHLARMSQYDPQRVSHQALLHKNWDWIQSQADARGGQNHGRRLHVWRWERPFVQYWHNLNWIEQAQDHKVWKSKLQSMVTWRLEHR